MPAVTASSVTERLPNGAIRSKMQGNMIGPAIVQMHREIVVFLREDGPKIWYVDGTDVTGFDATGIVEPSGILFKDLKDRGFTVIGVIASSPLRMLYSTLCLSAGVRHRYFDTAFEADSYIKTLL
ncbi:hypothetical protein IT407_03920 [Candidatus Uhrbacteria bacterium]|nr:hypothetical protein [Candidatus Uhrbacteria bacterium]